MPIQLLTRPGLADNDKLLHQLQLWMNERYQHEIVNDPYFCKRVEFKRQRQYAYATGKVTDAVFCLDDKELFRYEVTLDFTGEKVSGVSSNDFILSHLTDEQIQEEVRRRKKAAEKVQPRVQIADKNGNVLLDTAIRAWSMTPSGPTQATGTSQDSPRQRVRVTDASRYPHFFLAEGFITQTHIGGAEAQYGVKLDSGQTLTFYEKELFFL